MPNAIWRGLLPTLPAFEAAARHQNFSRAARELGTTQPAVSQQIALLEATLSCRLFERRHRGVTLTAEGALLRDAAARSREALEAAQGEITARAGRWRLTLSTDYGFAGDWLIPQLASLAEAAPGLEVRIVASQSSETPLEGADFAIRFGNGNWPRLAATLLFRETVYAVASPGFLARHAPVDNAAALTALPLLHLESGAASPWLNWSSWFAAHNLSRAAAAGDYFFNTYTMVQQAAIAGQGVALAWRPLVDLSIQGERLLPVFPAPVHSSAGYYLIEDPARRGAETHRVFRTWLLALCRQSGDAPLGPHGQIATAFQ